MNDQLTPPQDWNSRQAGVCLHISSLPGPYGIGEIGVEARQFVDTLRNMRLGTWQYLPLGPTAYGDSPYQPLSSFAGNEMLIDVGDLIAEGLLREQDTAPLTHLPHSQVDFGRLIPAKSAILNLAAKQFPRRGSRDLKRQFKQFLSQHDKRWLHDYALFRVLKQRHGGRPWIEWEAAFVHREAQALRELQIAAADELRVIKTAQFFFYSQWQRLREYARQAGIRLFGDMPIYIALDSADAWTQPELLQLDASGKPEFVAGVPPDYFSEDGQLWGNPLYDWPKHEATQFDWWKQRIAAAFDQSDIVRIDHFRGFESYWSVPAGESTARAGTWQPGPKDALFDALRQTFDELPIVAEDLGVITDEVTALRTRQGMPGMRVLQFCIPDAGFTIDDVPENCVCYTGTHDNNTTLGWFQGGPGDARSDEEVCTTQVQALSFTGNGPEQVVSDLVKAAFSSKARLAVAPMQDFLELGSDARLNTPGTSANNWRWRVKTSQINDKLCEQVANNVIKFDREP